MKTLSRRQFLNHLLSATAGAALLTACGQTPQPPAPTTGEDTQPSPTDAPPAAEDTPSAAQPEDATALPAAESNTPRPAADLAVAHGVDPAAITKAAVDAIGGIERFVKPKFDVIIKPNVCVDYYTYDYAVTTNPTVVGTLVSMCLGAGAKRVRVMDTGFGGPPESGYKKSGIEDAVKAAGGEMEVMSPVKFRMTPIPEGKNITEWEVYEDILKADAVINVPIAKHHSMTRLTLSSKNLLGLVTNPNGIHQNLAQRIADLLSLFRPELTVIDAVRILLENGPTGGSLDYVKKTDTVIASADGVAADTFATSLFGLDPAKVLYIQKAVDMGLGTNDLSTLKVEEFNV